MQKILNFMGNIIERKKEEFFSLKSSGLGYQNLINDIKELNLPNEKLYDLIKIINKHVK